MTIFERAYEEGKDVKEKHSGIIAHVIWFVDELYLDEGTSGISPVSEYDDDDFEIVNEGE